MTTEDVNEKTALLKSPPSSSSTPGGPNGPSPSQGGRTMDLRRGFHIEEEGDGWREEIPHLLNANEVVCRVCENIIQIGHLKLQYVAKCSRCNEATPIFSAPPGKKYVRCCCCCLLICRSSSERVYCPRSNCNRIIYFSPQDHSQFNTPSSERTFQNFLCPHCESNFYFNVLSNSVARCPHCHMHSAVDTQFKYIRGIGFGILAFLLLIIAIIVIATTYSSNHTYVYTICVGLFILSLLAAYRSLYYFRLKVSLRVNE